MARPLKQGLDYFPHDTDANNDEKIQGIKALHGMAGCGVYWELVEKIYRSEEGYLPVDPEWRIKVLAETMHLPLNQFNAILNSMLEIGLFSKEIYTSQKHLTSNGLIKRRDYLLKHRLQMRRSRADDDSDGEEVSAEFVTHKPITNLSQTYHKPEKKAYGEFQNVHLTDDQYQKLLDRFNSSTPARIDALSLYKKSKGKTYKDDYATILNWSRKDDANIKPVIVNEPINSDIGGVNPEKFKTQKYSHMVQS